MLSIAPTSAFLDPGTEVGLLIGSLTMASVLSVFAFGRRTPRKTVRRIEVPSMRELAATRVLETRQKISRIRWLHATSVAAMLLFTIAGALLTNSVAREQLGDQVFGVIGTLVLIAAAFSQNFPLARIKKRAGAKITRLTRALHRAQELLATAERSTDPDKVYQEVVRLLGRALDAEDPDDDDLGPPPKP